jgi:hypothetical protein
VGCKRKKESQGKKKKRKKEKLEKLKAIFYRSSTVGASRVKSNKGCVMWGEERRKFLGVWRLDSGRAKRASRQSLERASERSE